jgi:hypothetical protein
MEEAATAWAKMPGPPSQTNQQNKELQQNPDYIALSSSLNLLRSQHAKASRDIVKLRELKAEALADPERFKEELKQTGQVQGAPKRQNIARAPDINWSKYK